MNTFNCNVFTLLLYNCILFGSLSARKCHKKFSVIAKHSACLPRSRNVAKAGVSSKERVVIVQEHNRIRTETNPPACNMMKMYWDDEVALVAQAWAENCQQRHDKPRKRHIPGRFELEQNIAAGNGTWKTAIATWHKEKVFFEYGNKNNTFAIVSSYTQMVTATTTRIGCGFAQCPFSFFVCNYAPHRVHDYVIPYRKTCRVGRKLIDCGSQVCYNGGNLTTSCKCDCPAASFLDAKQCRLLCKSQVDPHICGKWIKKAECDKNPSISSFCPSLCLACPYGGYDYRKNTAHSPVLYKTIMFYVLVVLQQNL